MMVEAQEFYVHGAAQTGRCRGARLSGEARLLTAASVTAFGFGSTPPDWCRSGRKHLTGRGYHGQDMVDASLASTSARDGSLYDFQRQRVTLPISDYQGRIIAFGGRTLGDDPAKYRNSKECKLFDKSRTLFGFDRARRVMRERGRAIIVEGLAWTR